MNYNYKTNVQTLTTRHEKFNAALGRTERTTTRLTKRIGSHDRWQKQNIKTTYQQAKAMNAAKSSANRLGQGMGGLALRFVGYQMVLGQVMGAQQKMVDWVKKSITEFRDFEKKMAEVSTIMGDITSGAMPAMTSGVESLSVRFGKSATDMAKGLYDILSAAFDSKDAIRLLTTATKASIAGLADVSTSVDIFTSVLNAYGMTVSQAQHISDVFFQTIRRGKLVFEDLASAIGYVTPIAAAAGVAFDEVAAILATVTRMGLHVDMASRGLALTIQNIVSPTKQAADAARKYNVDMSGLALRVKGLTGFMKELNDAVDEHGGTILPEMIRNMRSLRVVMAVTSDEGIAGITKDLGLMQRAAGQTEMALTKMTNITQMQVDILAQSMQHLERRIGAAWSGVDIWWKKTQLWWGSLLSGGDANRAVQQFESRVLELNTSYLKLLKTQTQLAGKGTLMQELLSPQFKWAAPDFSTFLTGSKREKMSPAEIVDAIVPWDGIDEYMALETERRQIGKDMIPLLIEKMELETAELAKERGISFAPSTYTGATEAAITTRLQEVNAELAKFDERLLDIGTTQEALQPSFDYLSAGLDDLSQSISAHQTNIMELQAALKGLKTEVVTTYTAMSGQTFTGKLDWQIQTKESEVAFDRFSKFATMGVKFGEEFSAIEWFNKFEDVNNITADMDNFDGSIQTIINTMHTYESATKAVAKETAILKQENDELAKEIRKNNLEIMKIQLRGMMRRRGQTRSEEKAIKKIEIENAQFRIDQLQNTVDTEIKLESKKVDELKLEYDRAKDILDEYMDRAKFNLFQLKDIRDDEIRDLEILYKDKEALFNKYTTWEAEETTKLLNEQELYLATLGTIANRPETAEMYRKLYGIDAAEEATLALSSFRQFAESNAIFPPTQPLNQSATGGTDVGGSTVVIENVTIDVKEWADLNSVEKLAALLAAAQNSRIMNKRGRSIYKGR